MITPNLAFSQTEVLCQSLGVKFLLNLYMVMSKRLKEDSFYFQYCERDIELYTVKVSQREIQF